MPREEFEPAISMFKRSLTVLALDRSAIETGFNADVINYIPFFGGDTMWVFRLHEMKTNFVHEEYEMHIQYW
jgi:hypothetical protein